MIVSVRMMILFMSVYEMYYFACSPGYILCSPLILIPFPVYLVCINNVMSVVVCFDSELYSFIIFRVSLFLIKLSYS